MESKFHTKANQRALGGDIPYQINTTILKKTFLNSIEVENTHLFLRRKEIRLRQINSLWTDTTQ